MNARTVRLQQLIHRSDEVLAVLYPPTAAHARIMERAGCEAIDRRGDDSHTAILPWVLAAKHPPVRACGVEIAGDT